MSDQKKPVLQVIIASTPPGHAGKPIGDWFAQAARQYGKFKFLDEPHPPRLQKYEYQHTQDWSTWIAAGDACVFVMPEYNYSMPAPLKNALDYLFLAWNDKPATFVSYGGVSGGLGAAQHAKHVLGTLNIMPIKGAVTIPFFNTMLKGGKFQTNDAVQQSANPIPDQFLRGIRKGKEQ